MQDLRKRLMSRCPAACTAHAPALELCACSSGMRQRARHAGLHADRAGSCSVRWACGSEGCCLPHSCAGMLHPTINVDNPEDEVDMGVIVGAQKQAMDVNVALSNSFGFGGHNSSILFRAFRE